MLPKSFTSDKSGGVFYLHGEDQHRKAAAAQLLVEHYVDADNRDFNLDLLRGTEASVEQLAETIATLPMMADWRVVHVKETEAYASSAKGRKLILETAKKPPPGLVLILQGTVPNRSKAKFYKDLAKVTKSAEFRAIPAHEVPAWLVSWAREELGAKIQIEAAQAMAGAAGADLGVLTQEARKLAAMVGDGATVDVEAVRRGGLHLPRQDRWAWFDSVAEREVQKALAGLEILLQQGESPVGLVIGLSTQLIRIGIFLEGGGSALKSALPPYQQFLVGKVGAQARRWNKADLATAVRRLRTVDQLLKASSLNSEVLLEQWLLELALPERAA